VSYLRSLYARIWDGTNIAAVNAAGALKSKVVDEAGNTASVRSSRLEVENRTYLYAIAEGDVANHAEFEQFGFNADIDTAAVEDIWSVGGLYVFPVAAQQMELISSSADDDGSPLGTGIGVVTLYYLKTDGTAATEDITLNGTGVVTTTAVDIFRVNSLKAKTVGTGGFAAGVITIRNTTDTPIYSQIEVGNTRSRNSMYTVPKGKVLFLTSMTGGCLSATNNNGATIVLRAKYDHNAGALTTFFMPHAELQVGMGAGSVYRPFEIPLKFPAGTDIKATGTAIANNAQVSIGLRGWIENA